MKKIEMNPTISMEKKRFYQKSMWTLLWFSLFIPLLLKLLVDIPSVAVDYICNSYAPFYPTATTTGLVAMQVLVVIADILRAGCIGCVLCVLLYVIDRHFDKVRFAAAVLTAIVCPAVISFAGVYGSYLCVSVGLSRQTVYEFEATLPDIRTAALVEFALYVLLIVIAILCLVLRQNKRTAGEKQTETGKDAFFPSAPLFKTVVIAIAISGGISLLEKLLETAVELKSYEVTASLEGIVSYLVLPYLYLAMSLFAMLCFAALIYHHMEKKWKKYGEDSQ